MIELLDLIVRWVHVIAGIMWVGNSMLYNWIDRNLVASGDPDVYGDIWLLHSGGFYLMEKNRGGRKPRTTSHVLHWFKWQAYTTWLSGAALLIVVYYLGGRALLTDNEVMSAGVSAGMSAHMSAVMSAVGVVIGAWLAYEIIWRTLGKRAPQFAGLLSVGLLIVAVEVLLAQLSGRAAWVHVGAMLGTIMAGNVAFTIMPSQRELVSAMAAGRQPEQRFADAAKTRSIHNNYITFPVIALMMSAHFPSLYASPRSALALYTLITGGALVRHVLNIRYTYKAWKPTLAGVMTATVAVLLLLIRQPQASSPQPPTVLQRPVQFDEVQRIIDRRCASCHSATPSDVSLGIMPAGVSFDSEAQIRALMSRIEERAVKTRTMPPANKTRMTDEERALLAAWIAANR
jgi:uncharacterized membrane protein